ncbi:MAG: aminoacyl-tRNA hydrolase [Candidatus Saccharibacteria bacterium]
MGLFVRNEHHNTDKAPLYSVGLTKTVLIVGLGNHGKEYDLTRHNVGFACLDHFADHNDFPQWVNKKDLKAELSLFNLGDTRVILAKPTTFMNNSGEAIQAIQHYYKLPSSATVIVHDEIDIPFGQIRLRIGGGSAGHNGVKSLIEQGGEATGRVRIGIANEFSGQADSADFVLGKFTTDEQKNFPALYQEVNAILTEYVYGSGALPTETRSYLA